MWPKGHIFCLNHTKSKANHVSFYKSAAVYKLRQIWHTDEQGGLQQFHFIRLSFTGGLIITPHKAILQSVLFAREPNAMRKGAALSFLIPLAVLDPH